MKNYLLRLGRYSIAGLIWYNLSGLDKDKVRANSFNCGFNLSQRFKKYSSWDEYIEPLIIRQFGIIFISGHSFINGLISDNTNKKKITKYMDNMHESIEKEIK